MCEEIKSLKTEFDNACKTILKTNISKNPDTLNSNRDRIILSYNNLLICICKLYSKSNNSDKKILDNIFISCKSKIEKCFVKLNCNYLVPSSCTLVSSDLIDPNFSSSTLDFSDQSFSDSDDLEKTICELFDTKDSKPEIIMTDLTSVEFLRLASSTINKNYGGDPLSLQSFLDSVDLLTDLATTQPLKRTFVKFVLSKLEGKARESVTNEHNDVDTIVQQLSANIKTENSKVIEGRMQALRADRVSLQDFSQKAEDLADNFRRALVMEGIPSAKAKEMSVDKTVDMCRSSARSEMVKAILSASTFKDPKEVVSKFVIEVNSEKQEKQVLAYRTNQRSFQNSRNNQNNSSGNASFNNNSRNFSFNNNQNRNNRNRQNSNRPNNYSGFSNSQNNGYRRNFHNQSNVRYMENYQGPQVSNANQNQGFLRETQH